MDCTLVVRTKDGAGRRKSPCKGIWTVKGTVSKVISRWIRCGVGRFLWQRKFHSIFEARLWMITSLEMTSKQEALGNHPTSETSVALDWPCVKVQTPQHNYHTHHDPVSPHTLSLCVIFFFCSWPCLCMCWFFCLEWSLHSAALPT